MNLFWKIIYFISASFYIERGPKVTVEEGTLVGKRMVSLAGNEFFAFQGIPYAAPPVGDLRFQSPKKAPKWNGTRMAVQEGNDCIQRDVLFPWITGSEDCLYLNVYAPINDNKSAESLPVMVWIHGGGFTRGSGSTFLYGPKYLLDHRVVLVTINYRLGMLGFSNLGTPEFPGNYGLKDMVAALKWIQKNVAAFGGNPNLVTIFGESAGAASVHYLLMSPLAKGLFHRAIAQSGSAFNEWAYLPDAQRVTLQAAKNLGCDNRDKVKVGQCLRKIDAAKFIPEDKAVEVNERRIVGFAPSVEPKGTKDPFLPRHPRKLPLIDDVPMMAGLTSHEGMFLFYYKRPLFVSEEFGVNRDFYIPKYFALKKDEPRFNKTWNDIRKFYKQLGGDKVEQYFMLSTDVHFTIGIDQMLKNFVISGSRAPFYYYQFSYDGSQGINKLLAKIKRPGACHGDELGYLFNHKALNVLKPPSNADLHVTNLITKFWTNFAKTGNPNPSDSKEPTWLPVEKTSAVSENDIVARYMDINKNLTMHKTSLSDNRLRFWSSIQHQQKD